MGARGLRERYGDWALVTGASSGIGRAFAEQVAADGMNVVLVSNEPAELEAVAAELRERHGVAAKACAVDLAEPEFLGTVADTVGGEPISLLVNNAAFGSIGEFLTHPLERYDRMVAVNTRPYVALAHTYLPAMLEAGRGALVFVASLNALSPIGRSAVYTATKAFDLYFGCALWWELKETPVDALVVLPGPTRTGFQQEAGTKVATWAMEPDEVASGALDALGSGMTYVPGERNRELAAQASALPLEQRVEVASKLLYEALVEGADPSSL